MLALIHGDCVAEILTPVKEFSLESCFHKDVLSQAIDVPDGVQPGWVRSSDGKSWEPPKAPVAPPAEPKVDPVEKLAAFLNANPDVKDLLKA